jgi:hypothetical protein
MKLTDQYVSESTLTGLILAFEIMEPGSGWAEMERGGIQNILNALLELKQRRDEDRQREAANLA